MKNVQLFEEFNTINEAVSFGKKGIQSKLEDKLRIAKIAIEKWGKMYKPHKKDVKKAIESGKLPSYKKPLMVQGDSEQDSYDIFIGRNAALLAFEIAKVVKKYKKYEVDQSSVGAAGGWSGTMKSTVGGEIQGRANFNPGGRRSYVVAVTCGSGIDSSVRDKMFQELYELMFVLDQYNSSDGGVMFNEESGSNYHTIGLTCSGYQLSPKTADSVRGIINN
jgi:hypothetical protein